MQFFIFFISHWLQVSLQLFWLPWDTWEKFGVNVTTGELLLLLASLPLILRLDHRPSWPLSLIRLSSFCKILTPTPIPTPNATMIPTWHLHEHHQNHNTSNTTAIPHWTNMNVIYIIIPTQQQYYTAITWIPPKPQHQHNNNSTTQTLWHTHNTISNAIHILLPRPMLPPIQHLPQCQICANRNTPT